MNVMCAEIRPAAVTGKFYPTETPCREASWSAALPRSCGSFLVFRVALDSTLSVQTLGFSSVHLRNGQFQIFNSQFSIFNFPGTRAIRAMLETESGGLITAEPELHTRILTSQSESAKDWLCAWCLERVATENDRYSFGGQSEFSFKNPAGVLFHIITFTQTIACCQSGVPTLEHTWFSGHAWSYCVCGRCSRHLGWFYSGPSRFVGLIRDRIIQASLILN